MELVVGSCPSCSGYFGRHLRRAVGQNKTSPRCALVQSCVSVKLVVRMNSPAEQWCICHGGREHCGSNYGGGIFRIMVTPGAYLWGEGELGGSLGHNKIGGGGKISIVYVKK